MTDQLDLRFSLDEPAARRLDPPTSHEAAASAKGLQAAHARLILSTLEQHGKLGADGIAARSRLDGHQVGKRLHELQKAGLIRLTGETVKSTSGRNQREWKVA